MWFTRYHFSFWYRQRSFFRKYKKSVSNFSLSEPFIKTVMTRCIHCTRCTRFLSEVVGIQDLGVIGRGFFMEIGTFVEIIFFLNYRVCYWLMSCWGFNFYALCFYSTSVRNLFRRFYRYCWFISIFCKIRCCYNSVVRIIPRLDESLNEEWITILVDDCMILLIQIDYYIPNLK